MKRSKFSLSHTRLLSCNMGDLVPIGLTEVLPGDSIQQNTSALVRCAPLLSPVMHPVHVRIHHWFVPNRILWDEWEDFITGGPDGMNASVFPTITVSGTGGTGPDTGSLADYFGLPVNPGRPIEFSALPFRAYAMIFNEWYRDQDLVDPIPLSTASGPDTVTNMLMQRCAWEKDYFTTARPWTQKGPEITLPLGTRAPVMGIGNTGQVYSGNPATQVWQADGSYGPIGPHAVIGDALSMGIKGTAATGGIPDVYADLSNATAVSINDLREAFALQRYEEARARYGSRYTEYLRYLGVRSSDARLQRPEYLGGGRQTIQFSEVLKTGSGEDPADPIGEMFGHGIGAMRSNRYRRFFEEHGYIVTLLSVKPKTMYLQGMHRTWNRRTKEDFFQQELQHIGQQEIQKKEIYAGSSDPEGVFGYQDRYDEYRRHESGVSGEFRNILDYWHYARIFATEPALNADFVTSIPTKRVNASQINDVLYVMANHSIQARRLVSGSTQSYIF